MGAIAAGLGSAAGNYILSEELGGGSEPAQNTRTVRLPPIVRQDTQQVLDSAQTAAENADFVGLQPAQQRGLSQAESFADRLLPQAQNASPGQTINAAGDQLRSTIEGDFLSPDSNPALQDTIDAATGQVMERFERDIQPQLGSQAQQSGAFGGARHGLAEARAADQVTENIGNISSRMLSNAYQQERQRQFQAAQGAPAFAQAEQQLALMPSQINQGVGQSRRNVAQEGELFDLDVAQQRGNIVSGMSPGSNVTQTRSPARPSSEVQALQGFVGGMNAFGGLSGSTAGGGFNAGGSTQQAGGYWGRN